jgi:multisubunit Na+/H+ antiporter MnhF subunit
MTLCAALLLLGGLAPALLLACVGSPLDRLVGLQLSNTLLTAFLLVFALVAGVSNYLSVPLLAVPISVAGTLVYTRCLAPHPQ